MQSASQPTPDPSQEGNIFRSADLQSAVSQNCILRGVDISMRAETFWTLGRLQIGDTADCKSALRRRHGFVPTLVLLSSLAVSSTVQAAKSAIVIVPDEIKLTGRAASHQLIVEKFCDHHFVGQVMNGISFSSSDTNIVRIEANEIVSVEDGAATIQAKVGVQSATAHVI